MLSIDGHTDIRHDIFILYALYIVFLEHFFYCVLFVAYQMTNEAVKIIGN